MLEPKGCDVGVARCGVSPDGQTLAFTASVREGETVTSWITVKIPGTARAASWHKRRARRSSFSGLDAGRSMAPPHPMDGSASNQCLSGACRSMAAIRSRSASRWLACEQSACVPMVQEITFTAGWPKKEIYVMENFLSR